MPKRFTPPGETEYEQKISLDLHYVLGEGHGLLRFHPDRLQVLHKVLGREGIVADAATVRDCLKKLLSEPATTSSLPFSRRYRLLAFRAEPEFEERSAEEVRAEGRKLLKLEDKPPDHMRENGGPEWQLIQALMSRIVRDHPDPGRRSPEAQPAPVRERIGRPSSDSVHDRVLETAPSDFSKGLWWREETTPAYVEAMAALDPVAIYAGADGSSDVGLPLHGEMFRELVSSRATSEARWSPHVIHQAIAGISEHTPPAYLGSILRELYRAPEDHVRDAEDELYVAIESYIQGARLTGGFVARSIALLSFALRSRGRSVRVITAHFDADIEEAAQQLGRRYERWELAGVEFRDFGEQRPIDQPDVVPLLRLHGRPREKSTQLMIIGEADLGSDPPSRREGHSPKHYPRLELLLETFANRDVIFVGTSLDDPSVVTALARTKSAGRAHYAILLRPRHVVGQSRRALEFIDASLSMQGMRYIHLGVVPVWVDFRHQVPQLLHEVALQIAMPGHPHHGRRLDEWWRGWAQLFGYNSSGKWVGNPDNTVRSLWQARFHAMHEHLLAETNRRAAKKERVRFEVWLRNHRRRKFFLWADSPPSAADPSEPPRTVDVAKDDDLVVRAFRAGETLSGEDTSGTWKLSLAINLLEYQEPWYGLPVGVLVVRSDSPRGGLSRLAQNRYQLEAFEQAATAHALEPLSGS